MKKAGKKAAKKAAKKTTKKVAKKVTKKVAKKAAKKVAKKAAKKVTKKVAAKAPKKAAKKAAKKPAKKAGVGRGRKGGNPAFMIPLTPSPELAVIVGNDPLPRPHVVKKIWAYIKKHNLQDETDKRVIHANEALAPIWGKKKSITMFEMNKLLKNHLS